MHKFNQRWRKKCWKISSFYLLLSQLYFYLVSLHFYPSGRPIYQHCCFLECILARSPEKIVSQIDLGSSLGPQSWFLASSPMQDIMGGTYPHQPFDLATFYPATFGSGQGALSNWSKILGNFKLPKFDGTSRYWKTWDKTFIRFLSIHQLDYVVEENFLDVLPLSPSNFAANKMVYYILEDAITPGSLAAKYLRQAAKWNGNEAYAKLYHGYSFPTRRQQLCSLQNW
jgi:hypothetical protein